MCGWDPLSALPHKDEGLVPALPSCVSLCYLSGHIIQEPSLPRYLHYQGALITSGHVTQDPKLSR